MADVTLNIRHNADQATTSVQSLSNAMGSFASNSKKASTNGTAAANGFKKIGQACLSAGRSATKGASGLSKFASSIGRIAFYRAIRSAIRYVTDAFREGLDAAYNWSKEQGGANAKLAGAMDNLSAASGRMKLQLGAAFGGLITAIEPILIRIINLVTAAAEAITRFFAVLNGGGYYKKAVGSLNDLGSAAGGAGKQVKGLLAAWDELTVIGKESGGGGGGSSADAYSGAYVWEKAESDWANLFNSGDFFGLGEKVANALGDVGEVITKWFQDLKKKNIGKKLAQFINGLFTNKKTWANLGTAVGSALGVITAEIVSFFENIEWEDILRAIGAFLSALGESFFKELKDVFPEGSFADIFIEGMYAAFRALDELFTNDLQWKRVKTEFRMIWVDLKITALEVWDSILAIFDNPIGHKIFPGLTDSINENKEALKAAKDEAEVLDIHYGALTRTLSDSKNKTDELNDSMDNINGKNVEVTVEANVSDPLETNDLFSDRPVSNTNLHNGKGTIILGVKPELEEITLFNSDVTNKVLFGRTFNTNPVLALGDFATRVSRAVTNPREFIATSVLSVTQFVTDVANKVTNKKTFTAEATLNSTGLTRAINMYSPPKISIDAYINQSDLRDQIRSSLNNISVKIKSIVSGQTSTIGKINTTAYAEGGWPETGELFLAREAGPELVGTIGGQTAVANNDDIVAGIQSGVEQANAEQNALLGQIVDGVYELLRKDSTITISPSAALGQVVARSTALYGRA